MVYFSDKRVHGNSVVGGINEHGGLSLLMLRRHGPGLVRRRKEHRLRDYGRGVLAAYAEWKQRAISARSWSGCAVTTVGWQYPRNVCH